MFKISALFLLASTAFASAAECKSVGGHINGERATATRTVHLNGANLILAGIMNGEAMPQRSLPCIPIASGIWCEGTFGPVAIVVMTNGARMTETVTGLQNRQEMAGFAYACDAAFRLR